MVRTLNRMPSTIWIPNTFGIWAPTVQVSKVSWCMLHHLSNVFWPEDYTTVGIWIANLFSIQMVQGCSNVEWSGNQIPSVFLVLISDNLYSSLWLLFFVTSIFQSTTGQSLGSVKCPWLQLHFRLGYVKSVLVYF